ncbi:MAG: SDR family oxidoreductase [Acidobacteriota bacterium]|nr:SDR family oxidoreductase [Acidobacteriota bacterium]
MNSISTKRDIDPSSWLAVLGICGLTVLAARALLRKFPRPKFNLQGKVVVITGGSRGFGLALAKEFGSHGARLALCARDRGELERARALLEKEGLEAHIYAADIADAGEIGNLVTRITSELGGIDVLVNNAGSIEVGSFDAVTHKDFEDSMNLMFWAPVNLTYAVLPLMRARGSGHIVNISSVGGRVSIPHLLPYCCAKFALTGFSTGLGTELKQHGIQVLTVAPGLMRTGSYLNAEFKGASEKEFTWFALLGNLPGFSVSADYAAAGVREALERGEPVCTISLPAKVLIGMEAIAPDVNRTVLELVDRYALPHSGEKDSRTGKTLDSPLNLLFQSLTRLGKLAAVRLNE